MESLIEYQDYLAHQKITIISAAIIIAVITMIIQGWGILKQNNKIWQNKSANSLPLTFFVFQMLYCLSYLIYGIRIKSGALIISDLICFLYIPIIIGLIKFKRAGNGSFKEEIMLTPIFLLTIPVVLFVDKNWSLAAIFTLTIIVGYRIIIEFIRTKDTKDLSAKFVASFIISSLIWLAYAWAIKDIPLIISSCVSVSAGILFIIIKYKKSPIAK